MFKFDLKTRLHFLTIGYILLALILLIGVQGCTSSDTDQEKPGQEVRNPDWIGKGWQEGSMERRDINQSHFKHIQEADLECVECHTGATTQAKAGMPNMETCADCHEEETNDETDEKKTCLKCHTFATPNKNCTINHCSEEDLPEMASNMGPKPYKNIKYPSKDDNSGFSHLTHFKNKVACKKCHGNIAFEGQIPFPSGKYMPKPDRCFACHAKNLGGFSHKVHTEMKVDCLECHTGIDQDNDPNFERGGKYRPSGDPNSAPVKPCRKCHIAVAFQPSGDLDCKKCHVPNTFDQKIKPDFHEGNWLQLHGRGGRVEFREEGVHGKDCFTCHKKMDCIKCHNTQKPKDHINTWRNRGHGFMAGGNMDRCITCHRQDFCIRCHNETAPRSHTVTWRKRHCTTSGCHLDVSTYKPEANCSVCHRVALHVSAPHILKIEDCHSCHYK